MKKAKNKTLVIAIAMLLAFSMTASMMLVPSASAHTPPWTIKPFAYISVNPNPVGVDQQVTVYMWLDQLYDQAVLGNDYRFHNYELTITSPTGKVTTQTFATISDPTSNQYTLFTPSEVGIYTFNFTFPGQVVNDYPHSPSSLYVNDTYLPATASTTLTVQKTPIPAAITGEPLPTMYWTRPIFGENTNWYTISSNWLGDGAPGYAAVGIWIGENLNPPDCIGSQTSHVMWTKPLDSGGVVGGNETAIPGDTYFGGSGYNNRYSNPIIMDGMIYYQAPLSWYAPGQSDQTAPSQSVSSGTFCVDLTTGQLVWESTTIPVPIAFGYIYDIQNPDGHGALQPILFTGIPTFAYYWGTGIGNYANEAFDADTGQWLFNITNWPIGAEESVAPGGNGYVQLPSGPNGEILNYVVTNGGTAAKPDYYLAEWNSSRMWTVWGGIVGWPTVDASASTMYDWNISIPFANTMPSVYQNYADLQPSPFTIIGAYYNDILICRNGTLPNIGQSFTSVPESDTPYTYFAINLNPNRGPIGKVLWWHTLSPPPGNITVIDAGCDPVNRVFIESYEETGQWVGYSMDTGQKLWGPVGSMTSLNYYGNPNDQIAYGKLYAGGFGGIIYCYNDTTGQLLWTYGNGGAGNSTYGGENVYYGYYPTWIQAIGNGVVYTATTELIAVTPIYKGALASAINATTGQQIWTLPDFTGEWIGPNSYAIADGYNTFFNEYDNQIYMVGRGPSETTVNAPDIGVTTATPITITGTVMDISAGTTQAEQAADFPHGVPCASEASMTAWMGYVYQQQAEPTNFTGVTVTLSVTDSNHNHYVIGSATSDESGSYSLTWTPPITGNFTIYANFIGTNGYWPSSAETYICAGTPSPSASPYPSPVTGIASTGSLELGIAAVIIVIVIIGAVIILTLRKRP